MKMRVMYASSKGKVVAFADALGQANGCLVNDIPPAYPADKERLVILVLTLKGTADDKVRRFCAELYPNRAQNVALVVDGPKDSSAEKQIKQILREAGTNVIEDTYYVKCGIFGKKVSAEEREAIVDWSKKIQSSISE